ncbi:MAG: hypothetical protein ABIO70_08625 [Pseudomonadota bacterium]
MDSPPDPTSAPVLLAAIEATPLLGRGLALAEARRAQLARLLASRPEPSLVLRQRLHFGALLLVRESAEADRWLRDLAMEADARGEASIAQRARFMAARARCAAGAPEAAAALLAEVQRAPIAPEAALDQLLARSWLGTLDAVGLLREALERLPPARDHDRLAVLLELADRCEAGGDPYRARVSLEQALALAQAHEAHGAAGRAALMLGALLVRTGTPDVALPALERALAEGEMASDSLIRASAGQILVALLLGQGAWHDVLARSTPLLEVARERRNGALLASLSLDRATAHAALGHPDRATRELLEAGHELELAGEDLALNLVKARLVALLMALGPERFGALVLEAMDAGAAPRNPEKTS